MGTSLRGKFLSALRVVVPEFDTCLPYFRARLAMSSNIRRNLMSVECMKNRKISLSISVQLSTCEGKKKENFQPKSIMKTCRIYDDAISDTVL